jgi:hypothetical protein
MVDKRQDPTRTANNDPGPGPMFNSDDAPVYRGLESAVPDTESQLEATEQPEEHPVGIEVIDPHELAAELWPEGSSPSE